MKNKYHDGELWGLGPQRTTEAASCRPAADLGRDVSMGSDRT
jgi:hypothetical protein